MHCWNYQQPHSQEGGGVTFYVHPIFQRCHMSCPWPCCVIKDSVKGLGLDQWPWSSKSLTLSLYFLSLWPCNFKPRDLQKYGKCKNTTRLNFEKSTESHLIGWLDRLLFFPVDAYDWLDFGKIRPIDFGFYSCHIIYIHVQTIAYTVFQKKWRQNSNHYNYTVSQKNIPDVSSYNSRKHWRIFIIFGRNVTEKASNHMLLHFPTSPN